MRKTLKWAVAVIIAANVITLLSGDKPRVGATQRQFQMAHAPGVEPVKSAPREEQRSANGALGSDSTGLDWERATDTDRAFFAISAGTIAWPDVAPIIAGAKMHGCIRAALRQGSNSRQDRAVQARLRTMRLADIALGCAVFAE